MKRIVKNLFRAFGFEISRYNKEKSGIKKSVRTNALTLHSTVTGNYYLPTHAYEDVVANTIKSNQIFEKEVVEVASKFIKQGTSVLDVGANFGQMSVLFSGLVGEAGKIYSFDADDFIFEILKKNISENKKENVIIPFFGAVHDKENEILFFPVQDFEKFGTYGSYGIDYNTTTGRQVKTLTIDSLKLKEPISFMKVDIQGGDLQAMRGAVKTIERNQMPILFEYEYQFEDKFNLSFQEYVDFVSGIGYKFAKVINGHNYLIVPKD